MSSPSSSIDCAGIDHCCNGTSSSPSSTSIADQRKAILRRLQRLESANHELTVQKSKLEHQLIHVLGRLATSNDNQRSSNAARRRADIRRLLATMTNEEGQPQPAASTAPLFKSEEEWWGDKLLIDSSDGGDGGQVYSSLSDVYDDLCINENLIDQISIGSSNRRCEKKQLDASSIPSSYSSDSDSTNATAIANSLVTCSSTAVTSPQVARRHALLVRALQRQKRLVDTNDNQKRREVAPRLLQGHIDSSGTESSSSSIAFLKRQSRRQKKVRQIHLPSPPTSRYPQSWRRIGESSSSPLSANSSSDEEEGQIMLIGGDPSTNGLSTSVPCSPLWTGYSPGGGRRRRRHGWVSVDHRRRDSSSKSFLPPKGPPQIHIARRRLMNPVLTSTLQDNSTTSGSSASLVSDGHGRFFRQPIDHFESKTYAPHDISDRLLTLKNHAINTTELTNSLATFNLNGHSNHEFIVRPHRITRQLSFVRQQSDAVRNSATHPYIQIGPYKDFLTVPFHVFNRLPSQTEQLLDSFDLNVIKNLTPLVSNRPVYSCMQHKCILVQSLGPPCRNNTVTILDKGVHSPQISSGSSSEPVEFIVDMESSVETTTSHSKTCTPKVHNVESVSQQVDKNVFNTEKHQPNILEKDESIIHSGILLRLSNHLKIWRSYHAVLRPTALLLYTMHRGDDVEGIVGSTSTPRQSIELLDILSISSYPPNLSQSLASDLDEGLLSIGLGDDGGGGFRSNADAAHQLNSSVPVQRRFTPLIGGGMRRRRDQQQAYFEVNLRTGQSQQLRGPNRDATSQWMHWLKRASRSSRADQLAKRHLSQLAIEGWLQRSSRGRNRPTWCQLVGTYLIFWTHPDALHPIGFKSLESVRLVATSARPTAKQQSRSTNQLDASSSDEELNGQGVVKRTITLWTDRVDPIYFVCNNDEDFFRWTSHLSKACLSRPSGLVSGVTVNKVHQLLDLWRSVVRPGDGSSLGHSQESIVGSLSRLVESKHSELCVKMFQHILFLSYPELEFKAGWSKRVKVTHRQLFNSTAWVSIKYTILKHLTSLCFKYPSLKDELYLQLIKQVFIDESRMRRLFQYHHLNKTFSTTPITVSRGAGVKSLFCAKVQSEQEECVYQNITTPRLLLLQQATTAMPCHLSKCNTCSTPDNSIGVVIGKNYHRHFTEVIRMLERPIHFFLPNQALMISPLATDRPDVWQPITVIWECLAIILTLFLPSPPILHCLELLFAHTQTNHSGNRSIKVTGRYGKHDALVEFSRYATYCQEVLFHTKYLGGRTSTPSTLEVVGVSIRNPYAHAAPFSIPISLPYCVGTKQQAIYHVVNFSGCSDLGHVIDQVARHLQVLDASKTGACLFAICLRLKKRRPNRDTYHRLIYLDPLCKLCDVISLHEESILKFYEGKDCMSRSTPEEARIELMFRVQAYAWNRVKTLDTNVRLQLVKLITGQLHADLCSGNLTGDPDIAIQGSSLIEAAALLATLQHCDYAALQHRREITLGQLVEAYFPVKLLTLLGYDSRSFIQLKLLLLDRWNHVIAKCRSEEEVATSKNANLQLKNGSAYLRLMKRLIHPWFAQATFNALLVKSPLNDQNLPVNQLIWVLVQDRRLILHGYLNGDRHHHQSRDEDASNLLHNNQSRLSNPASRCDSTDSSLLCSDSIRPSRRRISQHISYDNMVSFGFQSDGDYFLAFTGWQKEGGRSTGTSSTRQHDTSTSITGYQRSPLTSTPLVVGRDDKRRPGGLREVGKRKQVVHKMILRLTDVHSAYELTQLLSFLITACRSHVD